MQVQVPIKTLYILSQIMTENLDLPRKITSLAPKGELPLADLFACLDKVTSQLVLEDSKRFGTSLQEASLRVRDAVISGKFYRVRETTCWSAESLDGKPIVSVEAGAVIPMKADDLIVLNQQMFNKGWVYAP